ncbi:MAG: acetolactate synthase small subunit, partial [archaeon]|nr:acetolactate synthase small subunit [archaeon]
PGVLYRAANMFRRRGFNIDSISVGPTERKDLARMTITINGDDATVEQLVKQLGKLIDVIKVSVLSTKNTVVRELALIKLHITDAKARSDIINYANVFKSRIIDVTPGSMILEITGTPDKIDAFLNLAATFGIKEMARTGITALIRG